MNRFNILGLGTALPPHAISQNGYATFAATVVAPEACDSNNMPGLVQVLYRRAGVQTRHSVLLASSSEDEATAERFFRRAKNIDDRGPGTAERMNRYELEAGRLAATAASKALADAAIDPEHVTHLVTVSCSGFSAPGVDLYH